MWTLSRGDRGGKIKMPFRPNWTASRWRPVF